MYQEKVSHPVLCVCPDPLLLKAKVNNVPPAQSICTTAPFQIISQRLTGFDSNFCIIEEEMKPNFQPTYYSQIKLFFSCSHAPLK